MKKILFFISLIILSFPPLIAQDMDSLLSSMTQERTKYATATFKSTHVLNGHSVERMKAGQLDFRVHHRFGDLNTGLDEFYGLDMSTIFLGLDYGISDQLMIGIGRSSYQKTVNGFIKYGLLSQCSGERNMPITVTLLAGTDVITMPWRDPEQKNFSSSRWSYVFQSLIARKFNDIFSLQLSPTIVHKNLVEQAIDPNDIYSIGVGGRYKLNRRVSFNAEYFYTIRPEVTGQDKLPNSLSLGFDIETGGHVFQLFFTNSMLMYERGFITETTGKWMDGDIRFGFNISRVFTLKNHSAY